MKDAIYLFFIYFVPMAFGIGRTPRLISAIDARILVITCMIVSFMSVLPYLLSKKCPLEILSRKHPIRNLIRAYRPTPIVYFILISMLALNIFNYLLAFNLIHLF
jgi:hypothetical protein